MKYCVISIVIYLLGSDDNYHNQLKVWYVVKLQVIEGLIATINTFLLIFEISVLKN